MKKTISLLLALVLSLTLCACGGNRVPASTLTGTDATNQETTLPETAVPAPAEETAAPATAWELNLGGVNVLGAVGELTFDGGFSSEKLEPPLSAEYIFHIRPLMEKFMWS